MAEQTGEKQFQPSARKLQRAGEKGQVPRSQELGSVLSLLALILSVALLAPWLVDQFSASIRQGLSCQREMFESSQAFCQFFNQVVMDSLWISAPMLLAVLVAGIVGSLGLGGLVFSAEALRINWEALSPTRSMENLFSSRAVVTLILSVAKMILVSVIVWFYLSDQMQTLAALRWAWSSDILAAIAKVVFGASIRIAIALLVIALADILYQRWKFMHDMRMTAQEVKQEFKDMEGSPEIKARVRRIRIQMTLQRVRKEVPKADVVLVNPTHYAVAVKYDGKTMEAPIVVAKGADHMADRIREIARAYGVPIVRRPELARTLYATVEPGKGIPQDLYMAVAEVLAMIYRLRQKRKKK